MIDNVTDQLKRDEGLRLTAYRDTQGILTIGYGHNLEAHGQTGIVTCTPEQAEAWLQGDINKVNLDLHQHMTWVWNIDVVRRAVIQNMTFNMGVMKLLTFGTFLSLVKKSAYEAAADDELHTLWAKQVGPRALRLSQQMRTGLWQ